MDPSRVRVIRRLLPCLLSAMDPSRIGNPSPTKSPDGDGSVVADAGGKKPRDIIFEAFGGEREFKWPFPPRKPYGWGL
jgi:hypothetical protein